MNPIRIKFRKIFLPFFVIAISYITAFTGFHYLLLRSNPVTPFDEKPFHILCPTILAWIPLLILLLPRLRLLKMRDYNRDRFSYIVAASLCVGVPASFIQVYLPDGAGTLTELRNISEIRRKPVSKFYSIGTFFVNQRATSFYFFREFTGKRQRRLDFWMYAAVPAWYGPVDRNTYTPHDTSAVIIDPLYYDHSTTSTLFRTFPPQAWFCVRMKESMRAKNPKQVIDANWKSFRERAIDNVLKIDFRQAEYFALIGTGKHREKFQLAVGNADGKYNEYFLLEPRFNNYSDKTGDGVVPAVVTFIAGCVIFWLILVWTKLRAADDVLPPSDSLHGD